MTFGAFTSERNVNLNTFWSQIISRLKSVVLDGQFFLYEWAGRALECVFYWKPVFILF